MTPVRRALLTVLGAVLLATAGTPAWSQPAASVSASAHAVVPAGPRAAASAASAASAAPIPFKQEKQGGATDPSRLGAAALIVLLALGAGLYALRHKLRLSSAPAPLRLLRVLDSRRLTPRASLHVVEFAGSQYLLAHSEQGVVCIAAVSGPSPMEPT